MVVLGSFLKFWAKLNELKKETANEEERSKIALC